MASGPRNYRESQHLLAKAFELGASLDVSQQANILAAAQVHATLALVAATALGGVSSGDWQEVILRDKPRPS